ncbi:MAG: methyltransferase domain-containing protein [Anaerolineae bacterium]
MTDFSRIATHYRQSSIVQKSASNELFELLQIKASDEVLDLGCGTGHLTQKIRQLTRGRVVGLDAAPGMIEEARRHYGSLNISFDVAAADSFDYESLFDVIFCNSAFQWFKNPEPVLVKCYRALKPQGRMGMQAPAGQVYSPNFVEAIAQVSSAPSIRDIFAQFNPPWLLLETAEDYRSLFQTAGFKVSEARKDRVVSYHSPEEVYRIFDTGAAAGYLNPAYYPVPLTADYFETFSALVRDAFNQQRGADGQVELSFFRIYLLAQKPE